METVTISKEEYENLLLDGDGFTTDIYRCIECGHREDKELGR